MTADATGPYPDLDLLPRHAELLAASRISLEVAKARGYRSVKKKVELRALGFSDSQCRVPALLVPIWGVTGEIATYQIRPDEPRLDRKGRPLKYETPKGMRMVLDVPPAARANLGNPDVRLFITEGARKGDAAVSQNLCCIALLGVWSFRGTNETGGKVALADWESIALNGRQVYIVFDSDVMLKPEVHAALGRLKGLLEHRGARVAVIYLRPGPGGAKMGLDDLFASGRTVDHLLAVASPELRAGTAGDEPADTQRFRIEEGRICRRKHSLDGPVWEPRIAQYDRQRVTETSKLGRLVTAAPGRL